MGPARILQGLNSRCNNVSQNSVKNLNHTPADTHVTLTLPYPLVTFHLKPSFHGISLERGARAFSRR
jgi:hypothetical protein